MVFDYAVDFRGKGNALDVGEEPVVAVEELDVVVPLRGVRVAREQECVQLVVLEVAYRAAELVELRRLADGLTIAIAIMHGRRIEEGLLLASKPLGVLLVVDAREHPPPAAIDYLREVVEFALSDYPSNALEVLWLERNDIFGRPPNEVVGGGRLLSEERHGVQLVHVARIDVAILLVDRNQSGVAVQTADAIFL